MIFHSKNVQMIGKILLFQGILASDVLIINSWPHCMKGGREFRALGIKERGRKGCCYNIIKGCFHREGEGRPSLEKFRTGGHFFPKVLW